MGRFQGTWKPIHAKLLQVLLALQYSICFSNVFLTDCRSDIEFRMLLVYDELYQRIVASAARFPCEEMIVEFGRRKFRIAPEPPAENPEPPVENIATVNPVAPQASRQEPPHHRFSAHNG